MATPPVATPKGGKKTKTAITRKQFLDAAPNTIDVNINGVVFKAACRMFSSRAVGFGYYANAAFPCLRGKMMSLVIGSQTFLASFERGKNNWLWTFNGKTTLPGMNDNNGVPIDFQVNGNITANKSGQLAATTFDAEHARNCRVNVNIIAIGSKQDANLWEDGGNISAWEKPEKEEASTEQEEASPTTPAKKSKKK